MRVSDMFKIIQLSKIRVGRIHTFRYTDQDKAETTNGWLSLIKKYKKEKR